MTAIELAATAEIDFDHFCPANSRYRATLRGRGGAATLGYGPTEDAARADLTATIEWNIEHNGRAII
ncbi:hypothetical protein PBI_THONKO_83 [Mycobacterium phage Thonko]|uniref:Uncharacterized protein n=1 Tax=Mycobacterium phage Thonko TaxID=2282910 RepID=A0A346FCC9_9CAUD|nr:hypothetical protein I5G57_gp083 [Mycobacterium phage Thonko]AXN53354.1 hypothetical protein PBI_THONKO_83 [Mycobacterium phage Thonko]